MRRRRSVTALLVGAIVIAACSSGESALQSGVDQTEDTTSDTSGDTAVAEPESTETEGQPTGTEVASTDTPVTEPAPTTTEAPLAQYPPCPVDALDDADGTVEIEFWHGMANELETALIERTNAYNSSQDRVRVELQNQTSYESAIDKYIQVGQDSRPDLIQFPEYSLQVFAQSDTFVPVGACLEASGLDTSAFLDRALAAYQFEGIQWSMPFNVSSPVLYYNRRMFEAAGLDPDESPITLEELRATSQALVDSGAAGFGFVVDSGPNSGGGWYLEQWFGRVGEPYADNGNGRLAPATKVLFDSQVGVDLLTYLQELIEDGLAVWVGDNPGGQDSFLKMIDPDAPGAMTIGTSAALGSVIAALGSGIAEGLTTEDIGVGPMPGPSPEPGAQVGGASLWIPADKGDEVTAAAWDFITFLTTAQSQSTWSAATGYVPVREDSLEIEPLLSLYTDDPRYAVPYTQLLTRADDVTANAPVLGPQREVRAETGRATAAIFGGADAATELAIAAERSNALIESYNARN
jgi:sn-glycerol 3-phosphate transport system substrate-binding protein